MTRVLVVGDIGQPVYHVGDEAMTISTAEYLADAGMQVILATRDADQSKRYLGARGSSAYEYMPFLLFPWAPAEREITLERLEEFLVSGVMPNLPDFCPSAQQIRDFVEGIQSVDAVVISGGGNLNSRYGWLLYERAAIALVAQYAKIPVFVSGQSIGPVLSPRDEEVLLRMLRSATSVAVRERSSYEWCREHDLKALAGVDDASDYRAHTPEITLDYADARVEVPELPERYVCVTVHEVSGSKVHELAALLDKIYAEYGLAAVFLGHMGDPASEGGRTGDYKAHELVTASMTSPAAVIPILHADATVRIHQGAALDAPGLRLGLGGLAHGLRDGRFGAGDPEAPGGGAALALRLVAAGSVDASLLGGRDPGDGRDGRLPALEPARGGGLRRACRTRWALTPRGGCPQK